MTKENTKAKDYLRIYNTIEGLAKTRQITSKFSNLNEAFKICKEFLTDDEEIKLSIEYEFTDAELSIECHTFDIMMPEMPKLRNLMELVDSFVITPLDNNNVRITMDVKDIFKL